MSARTALRDLPDRKLIDAAKTWGQVEWLYANGWTEADLARKLGRPFQHRPKVTVLTARKVARVYTEARRVHSRNTDNEARQRRLDAYEANHWRIVAEEEAARAERERAAEIRRIRAAFRPRMRPWSLEDIRDGADPWDDPTADAAIFRIETLPALSPDSRP